MCGTSRHIVLPSGPYVRFQSSVALQSMEVRLLGSALQVRAWVPLPMTLPGLLQLSVGTRGFILMPWATAVACVRALLGSLKRPMTMPFCKLGPDAYPDRSPGAQSGGMCVWLCLHVCWQLGLG